MEKKAADPGPYKKIHYAHSCPYLGTIKRHLLDFDFEKLCSISLSNKNIYACLVCGKYFQGKGQSTHAYTHSLEKKHFIFINLQNEEVVCLPEGEVVEDTALEEIKFNLRPRYTSKEVEMLDQNMNYSRALDGTDYLPGCIGLNNIKNTDYVNVILQALCRVPELRNFFMFYEVERKMLSDVFELQILLSKRFAELIRKIWNPKNFKRHVSPHELLQAISLKSQKQFKIDVKSDSISFLSWFIFCHYILLKGF